MLPYCADCDTSANDTENQRILNFEAILLTGSRTGISVGKHMTCDKGYKKK